MSEWKKQRTSKSVYVDADVDLDEFSETELLQALIYSDWISEAEAIAIEKRAKSKDASKKPVSPFASDLDTAELEEASYHIRCGRRDEAIIHLERFLGRDWIGALQ